MKRILILTLSALVLMFSALVAYSQQDYVTLDDVGFEKAQRPAAWFDHDDHNEKAGLEEECALCHHVYDGKTLVEDESSEESACSDCHSLKKTSENGVPLRKAFHSRCKGCHYTVKKGPVLCGECHRKS